MKLTIEVKGIRGANAFLNELIRGLPMTIASALPQFAEDRVDKMQMDAPIDTGYLRYNIRWFQPNPLSVSINSWADYSGYVNFGTIYMPPRPFFTSYIESGPAFLDSLLQHRIVAFIQSLISKYQNK